MKKALKLAIEGGFKLREIHLEETAWGAEMVYPIIREDPLFWQALGKSLGWGKEVGENCCELCGEPMPKGEEMFRYHGYSYGDSVASCPEEWIKRKQWKGEWHKLIDHIAEGKDIESFFNNLIK